MYHQQMELSQPISNICIKILHYHIIISIVYAKSNHCKIRCLHQNASPRMETMQCSRNRISSLINTDHPKNEGVFTFFLQMLALYKFAWGPYCHY